MNHLLYNVSVFMLLSGILILTYYLAKAYNKPNCPNQQPRLIKSEATIEDAYAMRPTQIFNKMFSEPSLWQGYESVSVKKNS
uniref:Uncharacterized protein n=1 Tax=viral metagenome TaxID=1070528 RepID=A0A6C0DAZ5_9ZZZZ